MELNKTWLKARSQHHLPSMCFSGWSEEQDGRPGLWLAETFSTSPLKPLNRIQRNLTGSNILTSSTKFVFFGLIRKTRWLPRPLIDSDNFDFSWTTEHNSMKLDRKQDLNHVYVFRTDRKKKNKMAIPASDWLRHIWLFLWNRWTEFNATWQEARSFAKFLGFFGLIRKTRWQLRPLIVWEIFDFSSWTTVRNSIKLDRKQDLNILYQVCVFRADRKNKMTARPLIGWDIVDFSSETAAEARFQRPLPGFRFQAYEETKNCPLVDLWKRWHFVLRCTIFGCLGLLFWNGRLQPQMTYIFHYMVQKGGLQP